jgi:hypothetical protein
MDRLSIVAIVIATLPLGGGVAHGQAQAQAPQPSRTCVQQYADAVGVTPANLIASSFEIKAGWPGGLWLQKGKETYFCNTGRPFDGEAICWTLREPVKGTPCP